MIGRWVNNRRRLAAIEHWRILVECFHLDPHAFHYFGIIKFTDMPHCFPQLDLPEDQP